MTDQELPDLLDRLASRHPVGPPPTEQMLATAGRRRRRGAVWAAVGTIGAVAAVMIGGVILQRPPESRTPQPLPLPIAPNVTVPEGMRLVAVGRLGILVPDSFATNAIRCGTPVKDSVVVDIGVIETCAFMGAKVYDSVWIREGGYQNIFKPDRDVEIRGVDARRQDTACETYPIDNMHPKSETRTTCTGAIYFPADDVYFVAESATAAGVETMLDGVVVLGPDQVGVPGTAPILYNRDTQDDSGTLYVQQLKELGLTVKVVQQLRPGSRPDFILGVLPQPGTVIGPGDTVTVTVTAAATRPAETVAVGANSVGPGDSMDYHDLTDAQIRAGATIHLKVGYRIWVYSSAERGPRLTAIVGGDVLTPSTWADDPNKGLSWEVASPGRTTITLGVEVDGVLDKIGTITVVAD